MVYNVVFSPDGLILASVSSDDTIGLWDVASGTLKAILEGHTDLIRDIVFSPDGLTLVSSSFDATINLWDVGAGTLKATLEGHWDGVNSIALSPDGLTLVSGSRDATVRLWDVVSGTLKTTLEGEHGSTVYSVAFSPDGTTLASGSRDTAIKLWDVGTGTLKATLRGHTDNVNSVAFSPDGLTLASGGGDPRTAVSDSFRIDDTTIKLWDVTTGTLKAILEGHTGAVSSVAFSPDGTTLASGGEHVTVEFDGIDIVRVKNGDVRLWDVASGTLKTTLEGHASTVSSVMFSLDGLTLASGSVDETIKLWDVATGKLKATLEGHTDTVSSVAFSPDGTTLVSGSHDHTVKLWDVTRQPKAPKATFSDHGAPVYSVAFSPDGLTLASGCDDNAIRLWRALSPADSDGVFTIADLIEVAENFGQVGENAADINGDGVVNVIDLVLVAGALGEVAGAPAIGSRVLSMFTAEEVSQWLIEAKHLQPEDPTYLRGVLVLEQLLTLLKPEETVLLANYPNPFNPETWIPYQLAKAADVTVTIYAVDGTMVRTLSIGHQPIGIYQDKSRAAYWDGKNAYGEPVASGVYFYTLTVGDFTATRRMLIRK